MKRNNIAKLIGQQKSSAGFTLIELLTAAIVGVIVIGAVGFGLTQVLKASKDSNAEAERRAEVARAYDFISDEIRRAELIEDDETNASGYTTDPNKNVVLALKIPGLDSDNDSATNNESRVLYYISDPEADSVWKGPKVLYRWGPPLDANGDYTNNNWGEKPLIDEIDDNTITPTCETGWTASSATGFAACISPNNKTAELYIEGDIKKTLGQNDNYGANTKTFARSNQAAEIDALNIAAPSSALGGEFHCNGGSASCSIDTEIVIYDQNNSNQIDIQETISEGGSTNQPILDDRRIKISSSCTASPCNTVDLNGNSLDLYGSTVEIDLKINPSTKKIETLSDYQSPGDDHKVKIYYNGVAVSNDTTQVYPGQKTPYQFLKDKGVQFTENTSTSPPTYEIVMSPNQVLLAFELGQDSATLLDGTTPNPGYDHQDNLVVLTSTKLDYSSSP